MAFPATLLPNGKQQFLDVNGLPLALGTVTMYIPSTTTFKNTWQDPLMTVLNTNPITLDAYGQAIIWGQGQYRQVVKDSLGNLIWDTVTLDPLSYVTTALAGAGYLLNTNNLSDVSSASTALSNLGGAPLASPTFTGNPSLPTGTIAVTQTVGNSTTKIATTAFVNGTALNLVTGTNAVTQAVGTNNNNVATTAFCATGFGAKPTASAGIGQWTTITTAVPAGGTWAYFTVNTNGSGLVTGISAGVVAGGTGVGSGTPVGFAWRIA